MVDTSHHRAWKPWSEPVDPTARTLPPSFDALRQLSEQDPLDPRAAPTGLDHEITVSIYGEVQKEVIASRLVTEVRRSRGRDLPDPGRARRTRGGSG